MLRVRILKTLKALCSPDYSPLHLHYNRLQRRCVHSLGDSPFSGPPSYATITRRFSSHPNPLVFFDNKKSKEAIERGEFVDIHDIGAVGSNHFDVLITDVNDKILRTEVAELVGIPYLQEATRNEADKKIDIGSGFLYGPNSRPIFPCVAMFEERAHWVFFIVDSGSPSTFLSTQTASTLGIERSPASVQIAGYDHLVRQSPTVSHFADLNILGYDFCSVHNVALAPIGNKGSLDIIFGWGTKWELKSKV